MVRAYIAFGANLGDPVAAFAEALQRLDALPDTRVVARSSLYRSAPVGVAGQPDYLNAVVVLETEASPADVLATAHAAEQGKGRTRQIRWGARTLDVDVLAYGQMVSDDPALTLPHPRATQRAFVMIPWAQIDAEFELPDGRRVGDVVVPSAGVRRMGPLLRTVEP